MLLDQPYSKSIDSPRKLLDQLTMLLSLGAKSAVITGLNSQPGFTGAASLGPGMRAPQASLTQQIKGSWPGTGDLFAAALEAFILLGHSLEFACDTAVHFISQCLQSADSSPQTSRFGAPFESTLPWLTEKLRPNQ